MVQISTWLSLCSILLCLFASGSFSLDDFRQAFPIIEPDPGHTKLRLARAGLEAIERITTPISAVAVIGPYRSGKSFLLNQLLSLSCDEGFGVGHMRDTKTKGIWVWGTPVEMDLGGEKTSVFFLDTEGFESVGKSNVYDDRIFALATVLSSVLIYNLPETIREADISRLSFAVELAEEFYGRVKGQDVAFEPAKLLWLIQRDFLQGKSVQQMVNEALQHVPNSDGDKNIDQVNQIRDSLAVMGDNSTAFSLPQMLGKSKTLFIKEYNHRLFNWLVAFSLVMVVVGRFIIKFILLEIGAWILFIFLETYTRMFWSAESLYYNPVWHGIVATWETIVYSPILDLDRWAIPLVIIAAVFLVYWRCYGRKKHGSHWLLPVYNNHKDRRSD